MTRVHSSNSSFHLSQMRSVSRVTQQHLTAVTLTSACEWRTKWRCGTTPRPSSPCSQSRTAPPLLCTVRTHVLARHSPTTCRAVSHCLTRVIMHDRALLGCLGQHLSCALTESLQMKWVRVWLRTCNVIGHLLLLSMNWRSCETIGVSHTITAQSSGLTHLSNNSTAASPVAQLAAAS